jgi:hypothetical protein
MRRLGAMHGNPIVSVPLESLRTLCRSEPLLLPVIKRHVPLGKREGGKNRTDGLTLLKSTVAPGFQCQNWREDRPAEGCNDDVIKPNLFLTIDGSAQCKKQYDPAQIDQ